MDKLEKLIMPKFKSGDRVIDYFLGAGSVVKPVRSSLDGGITIAYIVLFDETPDVRYNMEQNPTMVFASGVHAERM